jgi:nicotinamide mononucleotide transporter
MNGFSQNWIELISSFLGILGVWLNTRISIWAWPIGILSVTLAALVYFENHLFAEFGLQIFYIITGFYGWWKWFYHPSNNQTRISTLSRGNQLIFIFLGLSFGLGLGYFLANFTTADFPYLDAQITAFSLIGQIWLARKYLENWVLWMIVNIVSLGLYWQKGLWFFFGLYLMLFFLAIKGYLNWQKKFLAYSKTYDS